MAKRPKPEFPVDLRMPLRDALRGVANFTDATEDVLEKAAQLFPEPVRSRFLRALESFEQAGRPLIISPVDTDQIKAASRFLIGAENDKVTLESCASVFVYAWEHIHSVSDTHRHMISEMIVADQIGRTRKASRTTGIEFAAAILADLRRSSAIGLMPGLARRMSQCDETQKNFELLAIGIWLLTPRAQTMAEEEKLLELSMLLVQALQSDAEEAFGDGSNLARFLADTSAHL